VHTSEELIAQIATKKPGQDVQLQIVRGGHTSTVTVTLGSN